MFSRAFVYLSQNNYTEAHTSFTQVLKIDPKNPVVSSNWLFKVFMKGALIVIYWSYDIRCDKLDGNRHKHLAKFNYTNDTYESKKCKGNLKQGLWS